MLNQKFYSFLPSFFLPSLLVQFNMQSCGKNLTPYQKQISQLTNDLDQNNSSLTMGEKAIVGAIDWKEMNQIPIQSIAKNIAQAVGLISIPSQESRCTASLISENIVMTNWHCFPVASDAVGAKFYPNFLTGSHSKSYLTTTGVNCSQLIVTNKELDVALLKCQGSPGTDYGILAFEDSTESIPLHESLYVIHQNCDYYSNSKCAPTKKFSPGKVISPTADALPETRFTDLFHNADTLGGSSGSPIFSSGTNKIIALHHMGYGKDNRGRGSSNSGTPSFKIVNFIRKNFPEINIRTELDEHFLVIPQNPNPDDRPNNQDQINNSFETSSPFLVGQTIDTSLNEFNDQDFYKFTITEMINITLKVEFNHLLGDLDLYLYGENKLLIAKSESTKNSEIIQGTIRPGVYYLAIKGYKGAFTHYKLSSN